MIWQVLSHLVPIILAGLSGLVYGRRRAAADAGDKATDEAIDATLRGTK